MKTNSVGVLETGNSSLSCKKEFWAHNFFQYPHSPLPAYSNIHYWQADVSTPGTSTPEAVHFGSQ